jgi:hypothetical protein
MSKNRKSGENEKNPFGGPKDFCVIPQFSLGGVKVIL